MKTDSQTKSLLVNQTSTVELITPEKAHEYLQFNPANNRSISQGAVHAYACEMRAGHWVLTHQGIAFSEAGGLIDGQHRLHAIIKAGVSVRMMTTRNVSVKPVDDSGFNVFYGVDQGVKRTLGQVLHMQAGVSNAAMIASAANIILSVAARGQSISNRQKSALLHVVNLFGPELAVMSSLAMGANCKEVRNAMFAGTMALCASVNLEGATAFAEQVFRGENIADGDPAYTLRNWAAGRGRLSYTVKKNYVPRCVAQCFRAYCEGRKIRQLNPAMTGALDSIVKEKAKEIEEIRRAIGINAGGPDCQLTVVKAAA